MEDGLRERALRLLARREHSRAELRRKLAAHAEDGGEIERLLDNLASMGLLSDDRFAEQRVIQRCARYGNARLKQELQTRGVAAETIAAALEEAGDEQTRARGVWEKKFGTLPADAGERARQTRFLLGRGFSGETVRRVLRGGADDD